MNIYALVLCVFICLVLLTLTVIGIRSYMIKLVDRKIGAYQSDLMEKHCEEVWHMYQQTRGWRHDYRNHIQTMKAYLAMDELDKLSDYLGELDKDLTNVDTVLKTGNVMIDAILNSKLSLAKSKKIQISAKAIVPKKLNISEVDLSIILGNLMDNAMEACDKVQEEERFIRVYIDILKGQLYIYVMNAVNNKLTRRGKRYLSTKSGKHHGFGLMRMDNVVKKYDGYLERQNEEGVFATEIMLPL